MEKNVNRLRVRQTNDKKQKGDESLNTPHSMALSRQKRRASVIEPRTIEARFVPIVQQACSRHLLDARTSPVSSR